MGFDRFYVEALGDEELWRYLHGSDGRAGFPEQCDIYQDEHVVATKFPVPPDPRNPPIRTMSAPQGATGPVGTHCMGSGGNSGQVKTMSSPQPQVRTMAPLPPGAKREMQPSPQNKMIERIEALRESVIREYPNLPIGWLSTRVGIFVNWTKDLSEWGQEDSLALTSFADFQTKKAQAISDLQSPSLMDRTRQHYTDQPKSGLSSLLSGWSPPQTVDYKAALSAHLAFLEEVSSSVEQKMKEIDDRLGRLSVDQAILTVASKTMTQGMAEKAQSRIRNLLQVIQTAAMIRQALDNLRKIASKQRDDVENFLTVLIPQWILSTGLS